MPNTFAGQLRSFARAVDIVDDSTFDGVRKLIVRYVEKDLGAQYFELMREQAVGGLRGLSMFWSSLDTPNAWPVRSGGDSFTNIITAAYGERRPVWAVTSDDAPLDKCESISTDVAKLELRLLGEALSILMELYETNRTQARMTAYALDELRDSLESTRFPKLTKPHFFVAYSQRADSKVKLVIQHVLRKFGKQIEFTDWAKVNEAGNINTYIAREIARSRFASATSPNRPRLASMHTSTSTIRTLSLRPLTWASAAILILPGTSVLFSVNLRAILSGTY